MNYSVSVVFRGQLFRFTLHEGERKEISPSDQAEITLPDLRHTVNIIAENDVISVSDTVGNGIEKVFTMRLNYPKLLDQSQQFALCVTNELKCDNIAWLNTEFSIHLGRTNGGKDGRTNDIILPALPFVSRSQFEIVRKNGTTTIKDLESKNGTFVNGKQVKTTELRCGDEISVLTASIYYEEEYLRFENTGADPVLSDKLCWTPESKEPGTELFKRSPRIQERLPKGKIAIPAPPAVANKPEINWLATLLPAGVTIAIAVTMALAFSNTMMMLYSLPMTVAGVFVSIVNYMRGNKTYRKNLEERRTGYLQRIARIESDISEKREAQKKAMLLADPSPEDCLKSVRNRSTRLWSREPADEDFASVRLGTGAIPFSVALESPQEAIAEGDELKKIPGEIYRANYMLNKMPVLCNLRNSGVIGLLGTPNLTRAQLQNMIFHLTTHHCCTELKLVCFFSEEDREELSWLADLPHTHGTTPKESYIASTQEEADELFRTFAELFKERKQELQEDRRYGSDPLFIPYVLFAFFEPKLLKKADPINQYLFMERGLGVGCVMAAAKMAQLPKQSTEIITLSEDVGEMYNTARASERYTFSPDIILPSLRSKFGQLMKPLYCDEGIEVSSLPKNYTLFQMLGIDTMSEYDIGKHWQSSDLLASKLAPSAPIGILENGERIYFNSPPTGDNGGAHALIAGTAGAGKSEVLLSLVSSLALLYSPEEVSFLVIDFKGDSIAGKLSGLPHLRGVITNLDGETLTRSLVSIGAENRKRMKLFEEYNNAHPEEKKKISDIRDFTEKYREGKVTEPLPHLFVVVDEFAEMKKQMPDLMDQFLSAAAIGRSLGVHLILATQSPSGVVDAKIRANTLKQMCLKVANTGESRDMIDSDLAARIKDPGRGYLKIDDNLQLFQSAYGGGKLRLSDGSVSTQIGEVVDAIINYCRTQGIRKLPDIFCPPLPERTNYLPLQSTGDPVHDFGLLPIGIRDDPEKQFMGSYSLNVFARNTLIVGSQLTGKTNLLQVILRSAAELYSPEEVNIYILDFASLFLKNYELLPHVGGVAIIQEPEKITNLFRMLQEQVTLRREKFLEIGVSTFAAYRESGLRDLAQILLVVDDLAAAKAYFPQDNDPLLALCRDGLTLGISVVATATQTVGGASYLPTFANRIALYNNDATTYSTLLGSTRFKPKALPGRCLVSYKDKTYECQSYLAFDGQREIDRTEAIRSFCQEQTARSNGKRAATIPFIPNNLTDSGAIAAYPEAYSGGKLMFGLDYDTVKPLSVKLASLGIFAVSGQEKEVQNFQRYLLTSVDKSNGLQAEFYIVDSIDRVLQPLSGLSCVAKYSYLPEHASQMIHTVCEKAEERYLHVLKGDDDYLSTAPTLVLMFNSSEVVNTVSSDKAALESWLLLVERLRSMNVCTILGAMDNVSIPFGSELLKKFKDDRKLVFFDDLSNLKIGDLPYATIKRYPGPLKKGDGYLILGNKTARIRVPKCSSAEAE